MCQLVCCSNEFLCYTVLCLLVAGYLEIKFRLPPMNVLPRKQTFMWLSTNLGKSISTSAYKTYRFVPDSIKLGRAGSHDS